MYLLRSVLEREIIEQAGSVSWIFSLFSFFLPPPSFIYVGSVRGVGGPSCLLTILIFLFYSTLLSNPLFFPYFLYCILVLTCFALPSQNYCVYLCRGNYRISLCIALKGHRLSVTQVLLATFYKPSDGIGLLFSPMFLWFCIHGWFSYSNTVVRSRLSVYI